MADGVFVRQNLPSSASVLQVLFNSFQRFGKQNGEVLIVNKCLLREHGSLNGNGCKHEVGGDNRKTSGWPSSMGQQIRSLTGKALTVVMIMMES